MWLPLALALAVAATAAGAEAPDWGGAAGPASAPARAIGGHALGCLAGGEALPPDGPGYQAMRLSRDRFYGHPDLVRFIESLAGAVRARGLDGLLVGDLAQRRGGPMTSGHRSHQTGLDVDIWFDPAPPLTLSPEERETLGATSVLAGDDALDPERWTAAHAEVLRLAAGFPEVARIFVHPAIKRGLCAAADGDRAWLRKIRPWWGHDDHFHVRLRCPEADGGPCVDQAPPPPGDGCDATLDWWFSDEARAEAERLAALPPPPPPTLDDLPPECRAVLTGR